MQGAPTISSDGTDLSPFASDLPGTGYYPCRFLIEVTVSGTGTCNLALRGFTSAGVWGVPIDGNGNPGVLAGSMAFSAGTYMMVLEDIGLFSRVCLIQYNNSGGTPSTTATIWGVATKEDA